MIFKLLISFCVLSILIHVLVESVIYFSENKLRFFHASKIALYSASIVGISAITLFFFVQLF